MYRTFDLGTEVPESRFTEESRCPLCGLGNGTLCPEHVEMTKDYNKLREWINSQEVIDEKLKYVLEFSIRDRVSTVIEDIDIVDNRLAIQEYLNKSTCSEYMERTLKEIMSLEKAKMTVIKKLNGG